VAALALYGTKLNVVMVKGRSGFTEAQLNGRAG